MNLILDKWSDDDYKSLVKLIESNIDLKYKEFHKNLLNSDIPLLGVRTPVLKNIANEISKGNYLDFINLNQHNTYEEILIHGLILGYIKKDIDEVISLLDKFIPYINNWAINDTVATNMKILKKEQKNGFCAIQKYLSSNNDWEVRFGLVLLLDHFINDEYIDNILKITVTINTSNYYVKMANAWLLSICYIKYPTKTLHVFKGAKLDIWTNNKTIQKIKDSYRVDKDTKSKLDIYKKQ